VEINEGKIVSIVEGYGKQENSVQQVIDYGEAVIMPGLIDV
jgi:allantoinase